ASVVRQAGSISIGQVGTGGASGEWSGSQARDQEQENGQTKPGIRTGSAMNQTGAGTGYRAQEKHTPRQSLQVWPSLKYTSIISSRCLTGCKVESLIAGSTRWPALVLQLIRQVSPTIAGQSHS
ncbi:unnamed protein product, partial [Staurois parvus]